MKRGRPARKPAGAPMPEPPEPHWTVQQIAGAHQFTSAAIIAMILRGEIQARRVGTEYRISDRAYRAWLAQTLVCP